MALVLHVHHAIHVVALLELFQGHPTALQRLLDVLRHVFLKKQDRPTNPNAFYEKSVEDSYYRLRSTTRISDS